MNIELTSDFDRNVVERFITFLCSELNIVPRELTIATYHMSDALGMCIDTSPDEFIILVNEEERKPIDIFVTIAHEMVHVKQYMKDNLGWFLDNRSDIPYMKRWWEVEAYKDSVTLVEKFIHTIQKN